MGYGPSYIKVLEERKGIPLMVLVTHVEELGVSLGEECCWNTCNKIMHATSNISKWLAKQWPYQLEIWSPSLGDRLNFIF